DRVCVMKQGEIVEQGETDALFANPKHDYTLMLLSAEPEGTKAPPPDTAPVQLEGRNLNVTFTLKPGGFLAGPAETLTAVDDISVALRANQTIGVVGESGSGKSTLGRALLRLLPSEGAVLFDGGNIETFDRERMRPLRSALQLIFQDPFGSLSPRMTVGQVITEGLLIHQPHLSSADRDLAACKALEEVQLDPVMRNRYPHEFSGGQRQRIAIARAMILKPKVVILDEPTSALDRSVQKQIVTLLRDLQSENDLAYLFISHDLSVVRAMSDYVMVMRSGKVVEEGPTEAIFASPRERYTQDLMAAAFMTQNEAKAAAAAAAETAAE
ncbi:MAG: ATP-binding cassette domain-containing protein, partial [Pseudomonadota bacterium]